jgi:glycosyltransferase involved in cell wall biosynthesis
LNICFFIFSLKGGGAERVTTLLANHWAQVGHNITVITLAGAEHDAYSLDQRIQRISLIMAAESNGLLSGLLHNLWRIVRLRRVLRRTKADIAIGMMAPANCVLALAAIGMHVRTVGSERIYPPKLKLGPAWEYVRSRIYSRLCAIVAQTQESADWLKTHTNARRVHVISNPLSYPLRTEEPIKYPEAFLGAKDIAQTKILLSVGRLAYQKAFDKLIMAFAELASEWPNWDLFILGEGPLHGELQQQVARLKLANRVFLPGRTGNIAEWYEKSDAFVLTSHFEGFPNALIEAMSYGLPVVSVDCKTGPRDIIQHEVNGLLVAQEDLHALTYSLKRLFGDEEFCTLLGTEAIKVRELYGISRIASLWEELFNEIRVI